MNLVRPGNKNALIIANGDVPSMQRMRSMKLLRSTIICADGGANHARRLGITPNVILGDLDSISSSTERFFAGVPLLHIEDQNSTDLEKAISFCIERNIPHVDIVGVTGSRLDHATGALGCFKRFGEKISLRIIEETTTITMVQKEMRMRMRRGEKLSLIPLDRCTGITTTNLKYPLKSGTLELGVRDGISNESTDTNVTIHVRNGTLLVYLYDKKKLPQGHEGTKKHKGKP